MSKLRCRGGKEKPRISTQHNAESASAGTESNHESDTPLGARASERERETRKRKKNIKKLSNQNQIKLKITQRRP